MDAELIQILLIEDDRGDVFLLKESLAEATSIRIKLTHADRLSDGLERIAAQAFDVILLDLNLPDSFGLETLLNLQRQVPNIPIVVLSGLADDYTTIEAVRHGAQDFLVKGEISGPLLGRVLRYAIERKQAELKLQESEVRYRSLFENMLSGYAYCQMIFEQDKPQDFIYIDVNTAFEKLTRLKDIVGKRVSQVIPGIQESNPELFDIYGRVAQTGIPQTLETYVPSLDIWFYISVYSPKQDYFVAVFDNITERKQAEDALRENEERYRIIFGLTNDYAYKNRIEPDGQVVPEWMTEGVTRITGYTLADAQVPDFFVKLVYPADIPILIQHTQRMLSGQIDSAEARIITKSGELRWLLNSAYPISDAAQGRVVTMYGTAQDITERKRAEQALHESEQRYRQIIETAQEGIWAIDADNRTTLINQRLADMLGYTIEEILGKTIYDFTDEEGKAIGAKSLENRRLGINEQLDFKFIHKNGAIVWAILETSTLYDQSGQYAGAFAMLTDITHRKQTEAQLADAHKFLENIMTHSPVGILTYKFTGECLSVNEYAASIVGTTIDQLQSQNFRELDSWRHSGLYDLAEKAIATRQEQKADIHNFTSFGKQVWLTAQFVVFQSGVEDCLLLTMNDINERKKIEQALHESEEHYRQIIETAQEGIWTIDSDNRTTLANQRLADMLGYTVDEMIGKPVYDFMDEEGQAIAAKTLENRRKGINEQLDFKYKRKNGSMVWTIIETSGLHDQDGNYMGALAMLTDITERKQAEEKIRRQLARLTALSEIDRAISTNFDLQLSLDTVLVHVIAQLDVDAADVLLYDSTAQMLEYAAGQGFHTQSIAKSPIPLSKGHVARAVLNRRTVYIPDLTKQPDDSIRSPLFENEGFISYYAVPLFAKGQLNGVLGIFHRSQLQPDEEWLGFLNTLAGQCAIAIDNATLFSGLQRSNIELGLAYDATIEGWSRALDLRDKETEGHSRRVTDMSLRLARSMGMSHEELLQVRRGALLHDIGKMGVPDAILFKPGKLTDEEWIIMRKHPEFAYGLLSPIAYLKPALDIPYCHHEKWDGTGYPRGLKGEEIPLAARLFAAVDVWDALRSDRPYRAAWPAEKVREHILSLAGTHFAPAVVKAFLMLDL